MAHLLGVDTGGTYTDAVVLDDENNRIVASAKSLTTRPDLSLGVGRAIDAALERSKIGASQISVVSLSTTLATNALVEGQGGRVALVFIGFEEKELARGGLSEALAGDPVIHVAGGHSHSGAEVTPLDLQALRAGLDGLPEGVTGFAIASSFATRNPAHEVRAREFIREATDLPVTCSHELSSALGGPKRALTAVLNARLIGLITRLITACEKHLKQRNIDARLMVVRGDGALISAAVAKDKPIETILSGPAASIAGASWLTGETNALVSDIGGTTTDICMLRDGRPAIDPKGARVGSFRTMVEAVAMRTWGLGGDSEVHLREGLAGGLFLGPKRLMPISLLARDHPDLAHQALDRAIATDLPAEDGGKFVVPLWSQFPVGLDPRETAVALRLKDGPARMADAVQTRLELPALGRLVSRGFAIVSGVTPSDAAHVLGLVSDWDGDAAEKALTLFARKRIGGGDRVAKDSRSLALAIVDQLTEQTAACLLEAAFAEDGGWEDPSEMARHELTRAGLGNHKGAVKVSVSLGVPVVGLGASAHSYYGAVGERVGTKMILPEYADVANAVGAVVGRVSMQLQGTVSTNGPGAFVAYLPDGPKVFPEKDTALAALEEFLSAEAEAKAQAAGVDAPQLTINRDVKEVEVEGQPMFIEATVRVTASGRPRIATG